MPMKNFFDPESVAIIGASDQPGKIGQILLNNLIEQKYLGKIYPINPKYQQLFNLDCYSTVLDVEDKIDLAIIAIPASLVLSAVQECAFRHQPIKNIIVISAGFSESGETGKKLELELKQLALDYDLKILGPNCLGAINALKGYNFSFSKNNFPKGTVGLVMQSGAFTTAIFDLASHESFGFSQVATLGNKAVLDEVDFLEYFAHEPDTKVIGMYLEDIRRGSLFSEKLSEIASEKPVLILKAGNSEKSQQAIQSHTGAMAAEAAVAQEVITDANGLCFDDLLDFISTLKYFDNFQKIRNNKVVILTNAGGPGVVTTDLIEKNPYLQMMDLDEDFKAEIKKVLPPASSVKNPIDILGDADAQRYAAALDILSTNPNIGFILAIVTPQAQTDIGAIAQTILEANRKFNFPTIPVVIGSEAESQAHAVFQQEIANYVYPSLAVNALGFASCYYKKKEEQPKILAAKVENPPAIQPTFSVLLSELEQQSRSIFYYAEAKQVAAAYGINAVDSNELTDEKIASIKPEYPVVVKIDSPNMLHKNAKGGVVINIQDQSSLMQAFNQFSTNFPGEKIIMQKQLKSGMELILGLKYDSIFGSILMLGLGGIITEILNEKILWRLPTSQQMLAYKLKDSKIMKLLKKQKIDEKQLLENLWRLATLGQENPWIKELDINPLIFYPDAQPVAVDIKILLREDYK